jgi:hypothetical protein
MHPHKWHSASPRAGTGYYAAAVTLLAVFLAGLLLLRSPVLGYRAEATIRTRGEQKQIDVAKLAAWLESDAVLGLASDRASATKALSPRMLRQSLQVTSPPSAQAKSFQISLLAENPNLAGAMVNELAQQAATNYLRQERQAQEAARLSRLRGRVRGARSEEDRLRASVERLRQEQLSRVILTARAPAAESPDEPPAIASASTDPQQEELRERIAGLQVQRSVLLGNRTSEHPEVQALDNQIQRLQGELAAAATAAIAPTPTLPLPELPPQISSVTPRTVDVPRAAIDPQAPTDALINMAARVEEAVHQLSQATWDRQQAEHDLEMATGDVPGDSNPWTPEPARIVGRLGGTPSPLQMLAAGLLAIAAAGLMYRGQVRASQPPPLASVEEVRKTLEVPLVAELALSASAAARPRRLNLARTVRMATHLAEATVAVAVIVCLLSVLADQTLAGEFASDPLGALNVVVGRLLS